MCSVALYEIIIYVGISAFPSGIKPDWYLYMYVFILCYREVWDSFIFE
jgi:hypothetical protein